MDTKVDVNDDQMKLLSSYVDSKTILTIDSKRVKKMKTDTLGNIDAYKNLNFYKKNKI